MSGRTLSRYTYTEHGSKNSSGGLKELHLNNKVVTQYENPEAGSRDHVYSLDKYFAKLPSDVWDKDNFYVRPLPSIPTDPQKPWFTSVPVGRNKLNSMVKEMCKSAGVEGKRQIIVSVPLE